MPLQFSYEQVIGIHRLLVAPASNLAKRHYSRKKRTFFDVEYPEVTSNMVGPSIMSIKSKGKQPVVSSDESDNEPSSDLREILIKPEGLYQHAHIQMGAIISVNYSAMARGIEVSEAHSTIAGSQASNSSIEKEAFAYMADTFEEVAK